MKIAIPVKTNKENPAVAPLFGKAKYFAIVEGTTKIIIKNEQSGGGAVIKWLNNINIDAILLEQMGQNPYNIVKELDMNLYHTGFKRILLDDIIKKFNNDELVELDDTNIEDIINYHEKNHPPHDENHHHN
jgi:predicted Fe-Mo cluster-binding NifX family protein